MTIVSLISLSKLASGLNRDMGSGSGFGLHPRNITAPRATRSTRGLALSLLSMKSPKPHTSKAANVIHVCFDLQVLLLVANSRGGQVTAECYQPQHLLQSTASSTALVSEEPEACWDCLSANTPMTSASLMSFQSKASPELKSLTILDILQKPRQVWLPLCCRPIRSHGRRGT